MENDWETTTTLEHEFGFNAKTLSPNKWIGEDVEEKAEQVKESWEDDDADKKAATVVTRANNKTKNDEKKKDEKKKAAKKNKKGTAGPPVLSPKLSTKTEDNSAAVEQAAIKDKDNALVASSSTTVKPTNEATERKGAHKNNFANFIIATPKTEKEFKEFAAIISTKIAECKEESFFDDLIDNVINKMCAHMTALDIKKLKGRVEKVYSEKMKLERQERKQQLAAAAKAARASKALTAKTKMNCKVDDFSGFGSFGNAYDTVDDDFDFM